jgi:endonuclease/exonuclease/phosphatase (EEP) superfamily protein YafD
MPATSITRKIFLVLAGLATLVFALFVFAPGFAPVRALSTYLPFAQVLSFPRVFAPVIAVFGLLVYLIALVVAQVRRSGAARRGDPRLPRRYAGLVIVGALLVSSAWAVAAPSGHLSHETQTPRPNNPQDVTVIAFNTLRNLDGATMQEMIGRFDPDILVMPETSQQDLELALRGTAFADYPHYSSPDLGGATPTTVLISPRMGDWAQSDGPSTRFGSLTLQNSEPKMPKIIATHTSPPVPGHMDQWRADLKSLAAYDGLDEPIIIAGDFNATMRHGFLADLKTLRDAAVECGAANEGTWPADVATSIAAPIDHVLVSPGIRVTGCELFATNISDHRGIAVSLKLPVR